jgi:flagellin-like hook-associated protein FlgL
MSLRVTNGMMSNLVTFNMQKSLGRFMEMQTQMSSGKRINKPSDDPLGTLRDLDYRAEIKKIAQFRRNISTATNWQQSYDTALADVKNMLSSAKELAVSMSNASYDSSARAAAAVEVRSVYDRLIGLANSEIEGKQIFSGYKTDSTAFSASGIGAVYRGDNGAIEFEVDGDLMMQINMIGSDVFLEQLHTLGAEADLNVGVVGSTELANLNGGTGIDLTTGATPGTITITDQNLSITSTVDLAGAGVTTVQDVLDTINAQLAADGITDVTAKLGPAGNHIMLEGNPSGVITADTKLGVLHDGYGVALEPPTILLRDGVNPDIEVDFTGATTVGDIITRFNAAAPANVTMQIEPVNGKSLQIIDSNGVPLGLEVVELEEGANTATKLGIRGPIDPALDGDELNPTTSVKVEETTGTTAADLGILADFTASHLGGDLDPNLIATDELSSLNNGSGFDLGEITIRHGDLQRTIDLNDPGIITVQDAIDAINNSGLDITASINSHNGGIQIVNNDTTRSLVIQDEAVDGKVTKDLGIYGSSDMLGSLLVLAEAMERDDENGIRELVGNMELAIDQAVAERAGVGAKWAQLEITDARQVDKDLTNVRLLSEVEDADISRLITDLTTYENHFQVSLMATAKIIQPSLMQFLD